MTPLLNVLVIEDQSGPLQNLSYAIRRAVLEETGKLKSSGNPQQDLEERGIHVARSYNEAERAVQNSAYQIVLLDHRLPYQNQGDLENTDFDAFSRSLENIGYSLIPMIKQKSPQSTIIGTSSLSEDELRRFQKPDYQINKNSLDLDEDLAEILSQIKCPR